MRDLTEKERVNPKTDGMDSSSRIFTENETIKKNTQLTSLAKTIMFEKMNKAV